MRVFGYIYNEAGAPIGAAVSFYDADGNVMNTVQVSAVDDYFWIDDPDEAALRKIGISVSSPGYVSVSLTGDDLIKAEGVVTLKKSTAADNNTVFLFGGAALLGLALASKKGKIGATAQTDYTPIVLIAGGVLVVGLVSKVLDKLGLGGDPTTGEQQDPNSPFKPTYWRQFKTFTYAITTSQAKAYAETIHDAFGLFQDDYNAVMSVFSQMRTKANVSYLADIFSQEYQEDLLSFLTDGGGILPWDGLSKEHLQTILAYVNNLPTN